MPPSTFSVLFVCIGNVCRSPLAERLLAFRLEQHGVGARFQVTSAGLRALRGHGMHPESARTLRGLGGDPEGFRARQVHAAEIDAADLVLAATLDLRSHVLEEAPRALRRTFTIREFAALSGAAIAADEPAGTGPGVGAHAAPRAPEAGSAAELVALCAQARGALRIDDYDVPDPIGRSTAVFDDVATLLDGELDVVARALLATT